LATSIGAGGARSSCLSLNKSMDTSPLAVKRKYVDSASTSLRIPAGQAISIVTALVQSVFISSSSSPSSSPSLDPASTVSLRSPRAPAPPPPTAVAAAATAWRSTFWTKSSVSLPSLLFLEYLWYGSLYVTAGFAWHGSARKPPGLYGPWVTSDKPSWNGNYYSRLQPRDK
jgi:hypothetical protein